MALPALLSDLLYTRNHVAVSQTPSIPNVPGKSKQNPKIVSKTLNTAQVIQLHVIKVLTRYRFLRIEKSDRKTESIYTFMKGLL